MSRLNQTILQPDSAYIQGLQSPVVDLTFGGQMGFSPEYAEWVSNAAYIRRPVIPLLIEGPRAMNLLPNGQKCLQILRSLIELHPMSIDGLNRTLTVDTQATAFGGSGLMQDDPTNVKETPSTPNFHYVEKYGRAISRFFAWYITTFIMNPYTKFADIATYVQGDQITDLLPDQYACTMMFIEPDPTMRKVVQAWLITNMFPKMSGDVQAGMDKTQDMNPTNIEIQWTGIHQYGAGVDLFAQQILNNLSIVGANPNTQAAFVQDLDARVRATTKSFASGISDIANNQVVV